MLLHNDTRGISSGLNPVEPKKRLENSNPRQEDSHTNAVCVSEVPFHKEVIPAKPKEKQSGGASFDIGSTYMSVFKL